MLCEYIAINKIPNISALFLIAYWPGSKIKIMQLNESFHTESPGIAAENQRGVVIRQ